jgi:hypothetical protein
MLSDAYGRDATFCSSTVDFTTTVAALALSPKYITLQYVVWDEGRGFLKINN